MLPRMHLDHQIPIPQLTCIYSVFGILQDHILNIWRWATVQKLKHCAFSSLLFGYVFSSFWYNGRLKWRENYLFLFENVLVQTPRDYHSDLVYPPNMVPYHHARDLGTRDTKLPVIWYHGVQHAQWNGTYPPGGEMVPGWNGTPVYNRTVHVLV